MFPPVRQRLCIVLAAALAGLMYLWGGEAAFAARGIEAPALLGAASPAQAVGWFVLLSIPAAILCALTAATGNPVGGVFALAVGLLFPAAAGGSVDPWLRATESSAAYWSLVGETLIWAAILLVATLTIYALGLWLRATAPAVITGRPADEHEPRPNDTPDPDDMPDSDTAAQTRETLRRTIGDEAAAAFAAMQRTSRTTRHASAQTHMLLSGLVATVIGLFLAALLIRSAEPQQALWGVGLAFLLAGVVAHQLFPRSHPLGVLLSPLLAAILWYAWAAVTLGDAPVMLYSYYTGDFPHGALALPIHYASAGVAGAAAGVGWSHALLGGQETDERPSGAHDAPAPEAKDQTSETSDQRPVD